MAIGVAHAGMPEGNADPRSPKQYKSRRRGRQTREDLGLPPDEELTKLVASYLEYAGELWPELLQRGLLPAPTPEAVAELKTQFVARHRTGAVDPASLQRYIDGGLSLAIDYSRYSHEGSDPKSVWDQFRLALDRAKAEGNFIPWELFLADYARSAFSGHRQGFKSLLAVIQACSAHAPLVYIDDFHRGSRNDQDWWKLARLCRQFQVRLLGVSDGFNLDGEDWDTKLGIYNVFSTMDTKYKRQRVRRGMLGAARENRPLGRPA
ncbi:MAG TPA: recombinase family protein, partial [Lacipirellulaceae bacterium]|nr:recombinase family protein [Lacipirellulaceae bacterium]